MRLAVSNLAWDPSNETALLECLREAGVEGIEIAPTKLWPDWNGATVEAAHAYRCRIESLGLRIPSVQAILFARPQCKLFGDQRERRAFVEHLRFVAELTAAFGATAVVWGAPSSRSRGAFSPADAFTIATETLQPLAEYYHHSGVVLCIEPNPAQYGCDFIMNSTEGIALAAAVGSPAFALHLDAAAMYLAGENAADAIPRSMPYLRHFHISEPQLGGFDGTLQVRHAELGRLLRQSQYNRWLSIEMRPQAGGDGAVLNASTRARALYFKRRLRWRASAR